MYLNQAEIVSDLGYRSSLILRNLARVSLASNRVSGFTSNNALLRSQSFLRKAPSALLGNFNPFIRDVRS